MGKISISGPKPNGEFCDNCRREVPVVRISDGALVLAYVCRECTEELYESIKRAFAG